MNSDIHKRVDVGVYKTGRSRLIRSITPEFEKREWRYPFASSNNSCNCGFGFTPTIRC